MSLAAQIAAIRASAAAIAAQCDALLDGVLPPPGAAGTEVACAHALERRTPVPRMGASEAWVCACGVEGGT